MTRFLQAIINVVWAKLYPYVTSTRVVERQMDGCMAHYMSREDYGTVIGHDRRLLKGHSDFEKVAYWLIQFDGDREDQWYPKCFFSDGRDDDGTRVRTC